MTLDKLKHSYEDIIRAITDAGGRFVFVGGCVRDSLLGYAVKDYDAEVYNLFPEQLEKVLKKGGPVSFAGQSFGVYHLHHRHLEISIPRKDQKTGSGHRGFKVTADPFLSFEEASKRRDLTMNSMGYDPIQELLLDPWQGQKDMADNVLRATDPNTFGEDPLRALRVMQLTARFLMRPDDTLLKLCSEQDLSELPSERILGEFNKLLVKGQRPSWGFEFLKNTGLLRYVEGVREVKDAAWHGLLEKVDKVPHEMSHQLRCHTKPDKGTLRIPAHGVDSSSWCLTPGSRNIALDSELNRSQIKPVLGPNPESGVTKNLDPGVKHQNDDNKENQKTYKKFGFMLTIIAWHLLEKNYVDAFLRYLKVSKDLYKQVTQGYALLNKVGGLALNFESPYSWRHWAYHIHKGPVSFSQMERLISLLHTQDLNKKFHRAVKAYHLDKASKMCPIVQGQDLIDKGLKPGKNFSNILKKCHEYQLHKGCFDKKKILKAL